MEKSPFLMGKFTISMARFNSYVSLPVGKSMLLHGHWFGRDFATNPSEILHQK